MPHDNTMERFAIIKVIIDHTKTAVEKFATISVQALKRLKINTRWFTLRNYYTRTKHIRLGVTNLNQSCQMLILIKFNYLKTVDRALNLSSVNCKCVEVKLLISYNL